MRREALTGEAILTPLCMMKTTPHQELREVYYEYAIAQGVAWGCFIWIMVELSTTQRKHGWQYLWDSYAFKLGFLAVFIILGMWRGFRRSKHKLGPVLKGMDQPLSECSNPKR
jgi:hypothetical protein